jgi:hypothetical protein
MSVSFKSDRIFDVAPLLSVEELYRLYGAWAGIHSFSFDSPYDSLVANGSWTGPPSPSFSSGSITLNATAQSAGYYPVINNDCSIASSYSLQYTKNALRQGAVIASQGGSDYMVGTDASGYPVVYKRFGGSATYTQLVYTIPVVTPVQADVVIAFRQIQLADVDNEFWYVFSLYMNDRLYMTYVEKASLAITNLKFGLMAYGGETITYSNVRVPELSEHAEYGTIDPGADAISGIQRAIEGRYIRNFVRFNGQLRAFRPKTISSSKSYTDTADVYQDRDQTEASSIYSHVRMMGAYKWAEAHDPALTAQYGHKFTEENNPMLFTEPECQIEATRTLKRYLENAITASAQTQASPLIEPEDRITSDSGDWVVSGLNQQFETAEIPTDLDLRKYVWG